MLPGAGRRVVRRVAQSRKELSPVPEEPGRPVVPSLGGRGPACEATGILGSGPGGREC